VTRRTKIPATMFDAPVRANTFVMRMIPLEINFF
jgi:hypothetical protein